MRVIFTCLLLAIFISCSPQAPYLSQKHYNAADLCTRAHCSYVRALFHDNPGVVESAMMCLVKLKMQYPEVCCKQELAQIDYLTTNGLTPSVRYRAFVSGLYLRYPELVKVNDFYLLSKNDSEFYAALTGELNGQILAKRMPE